MCTGLVIQGIVQACKRAGSEKQSVAYGDKVNAKVVLVKPDAGYYVVQLERHEGVLGFLPMCDYNIQHGIARKLLEHGEIVTATVVSVPGSAKDGRLLLHTSLLPSKRVSSKLAHSKLAQHPPGTTLTGTVSGVHGAFADIAVECGNARLNASEVQELDAHTSPVRSTLIYSDHD